MSTITDRLRQIAAVLDTAGPDLPDPLTVDLYEQPQVVFNFWGEDDARDQAAQIIRAFGGQWEKHYRDEYFRAERVIDGVLLRIACSRAAVCERVVVGTREVTKTVPVDTKEITVTEEIVEWNCSPLLGGAPAEVVSIERDLTDVPLTLVES